MPPRKKKPTKTAPKTLSLEVAMDELAGIIGELESGQQPLNDALEKFERGMRLLKDCNRQLEEAAGRIEIVRRMTEEGAEVEPFDGTATVDRKQSVTDDNDSSSLF